MNNTRTKVIDLPDIQIDEKALNNVIMVDPIDFLSKEENEKIIERVKEGLKNINNPERWMTWEECDKLLAEKYFGGNV